MMPKLSVITINYNNKSGLEKTIQSLFSQTFTDFEYIVIDGGSTDGSIDIINKYSNKITYWVSEKDNGIYDALNKGIAKSTGEYCYFLNSGDYLSNKDVFDNVFKNKPSEDIIYGDVSMEMDGIITGHKLHPDKLSTFYLLTEVIAHQAQFIKRDLFQKFGNYDLKYKIVSDYELFVRMFFKHTISTRHVPIDIAVFDLSGLSNRKEQLAQINVERNTIHNIYFPKVLTTLYHGYAKILHSKFYKIPAVASVVKVFRGFAFYFIKPKAK